MEDQLFNNNPLYMKSLIGKEVLIETIESKTHTGIVYVIDPIYKHVVLGQKHSSLEIEIVLYPAIKSLEVLSETVHEGYLKLPAKSCNSSDVIQKKEKLMKWLKHVFINVVDDGEFLKIENHLLIAAPYGVNDCYCDNTIILEKIRNIITLMPENFE